MLIMRGMGCADQEHHHWMQEEGITSNSPNVRKQAFADKFCKVINEQILGTENDPSQFQLYFEEDVSTGNKFKLCPISLTNNSIRKVMDQLELLIDVSDSDDGRKVLWKECIKNYRSALEILRKKNR